MRRARLRKMYVGEKIKAEIVTEALVRKRWGNPPLQYDLT